MSLIALLAQAAAPIPPGDPSFRLTTGGWVIMLLSVGFVTGLISWCIWRVTHESSPDKLHSTIDIEPPDEAAERREHMR